MNRIGIVCIDAVPTVGIQLRVNELKPFVGRVILFTQHRMMTQRNYWGMPVAAGMDNLKVLVSENADSSTVVVNYRQRIKDFDPGKYPDPIKGVWHELRGDGSTAYGMEAFRGVSAILGKSFLMLAEDFVGKELKISEAKEPCEASGEVVDRKQNGNESPSRGDSLPILPVVFITHNRTAVACRCLSALIANLRYSGEIHFCVCDDLSEAGHVEALVATLRNAGVSRFSVSATSKSRHGLGASMNNGLRWAFRLSPVALTVEDDFLLVRCANMDNIVARGLRNDVAGIKLAANFTNFGMTAGSDDMGFVRLVANPKANVYQRYLFNNLVMLRTRRAFDTIGFYTDTVDSALSEFDMVCRFNKATNDGHDDGLKILWPGNLKLNTMSAGWFEHIGSSTLGHNHKVSCGYEALNGEAAALMARSVKKQFFSIIVPTYNDPDLLDRCLSSIDTQSFDDYLAIVVDDKSENDMDVKGYLSATGHRNTVFMPLRDKACAGGARNRALDTFPSSQYTMFLDSDDELLSPTVLYEIHEHVNRAGFPDIVALDYMSEGGIRHFSKESGKIGVAPWTRCTKTSKVERFVEDRMMCNDTVQYLRTLQSGSSVSWSGITAVKYNHDNPESGWNSNKAKSDMRRIRAMLNTMVDIKEGNWTGKASAEARRMFLYIKNRADNTLV